MRRFLLAASLGLCALGIGEVAIGAAVPVKAVVAQVLLERAFDRGLAAHHPTKPWPWADMAPVARISVPRLGLNRVVLDTGSGQAMAFGPTLLPGGARLAAPGTAVLAAHRDTHFRFLDQLRPGDRILVERLDGPPLRYRVTGAEVVRWDRFAIPDEGSVHELVLAICYPFGMVAHGRCATPSTPPSTKADGCCVQFIGLRVYLDENLRRSPCSSRSSCRSPPPPRCSRSPRPPPLRSPCRARQST